MNILVICCDTFRHDHLGFLGKQAVQTPNLDRLAKESANFSDYRLCSFPTVINRIEVFTGRYTFPFFDWGNLPHYYPVCAEVFKHHGYATCIIADNPHLLKEDRGFERGFDTVKFVRGQTDLPFQPDDAPMADLPCPAEKLEPRESRLNRYRQNAYWFQQHGTSTTEQVFDEAIRWLEPARNNFFLWIDSFDPHEPWDAPLKYRESYPWNKDADAVIWPHNGKASRYSEAELANMRTLYKAEVTQSDHCIGKLMAHLKTTGLLETTTVIFCSDHGFYFGEHGLLGKLRMHRPTTFYEELAHVPLLIRHPKGLSAGQVIPGLCQPPDLFATALELAGIGRVPWLQGYSLLPRLHGQPSPQRFGFAGCFPRSMTKGRVSCLSVWSDEWSFIYSPFEGLEGSELYHRPSDPNETRNVIAENREFAREHFQTLCSWFKELGVPQNRLDQLLLAKRVTWLERIRQKLWLRRNERFYRKHFGNYASGPSAVSIPVQNHIPFKAEAVTKSSRQTEKTP